MAVDIQQEQRATLKFLAKEGNSRAEIRHLLAVFKSKTLSHSRLFMRSKCFHSRQQSVSDGDSIKELEDCVLTDRCVTLCETAAELSLITGSVDSNSEVSARWIRTAADDNAPPHQGHKTVEKVAKMVAHCCHFLYTVKT